MKLVFATNNAHKLEEVRQILGKQFEILSLAEIGCFDEIPETADSLQGNALQKAMHVYQKYGIDCFADDTGFEIEALDGRPGVFSARYAGEPQNSTKNRAKVLGEMHGKENRNARFCTVIALILGGKTHCFEGEVQGRVTDTEKGANGFGYDSIFVPQNYTQTFAELPITIKNSISHRAQAVKKLTNFLTQRSEI